VLRTAYERWRADARKQRLEFGLCRLLGCWGTGIDTQSTFSSIAEDFALRV
jgi:hypothetical protein